MFRKISTTELIFFLRQLAALLKAGIPLTKGLDTVAVGIRSKKFKELISSISLEIKSGAPFSQAVSNYPAIFSEVLISLIRVGESGGILAETIARAVAYLEEKSVLKDKIKAALAYPVLVLMVSFLTLIFLITGLLPIFDSIFKDLGIRLPLITSLVIGFGELVISFWYVIIGILIFLWFLLRGHISENLWFKLPLIKQVVLTRTLRTLGRLLEGSVPILSALKIAAATSGSQIYKKAFEKIKGEVEAGEKLASALNRFELFPEMVVQMVAAGESSGTLSEMLLETAEYYEKEAERQVKILASLIEPAATLGVGIVVGIIVMAMFLPLLKVASSLAY